MVLVSRPMIIHRCDHSFNSCTGFLVRAFHCAGTGLNTSNHSLMPDGTRFKHEGGNDKESDMGTVMRRDIGEAPNQIGAEVVEKETSFS